MKSYVPLQNLITKYKVSKAKVYAATAKKEFPFRRSAKVKGRIYVNETDFLNWLAPYEIEAVPIEAANN